MRAASIHQAWQALPFGSIDTIFPPGRIAILAPHADDESLGCGGLIALLCRLRRPPLVIILTDGTKSHPRAPAATLRRIREAEAAAALRELGMKQPQGLKFLRLPDTKAPHRGPQFAAAAAATRLARLARGCAALCGTWQYDPHCDHTAAALLAAAAAARLRIPHRAYPVWGWTLPDAASVPESRAAGWRLDIAAAIQAKRRAIAAHRSQHGQIFANDTDAFTLPRALLSVFERPYEVFLRP
jgi:LmbE family N-acetylglucosaminyl deacetylase